ncbi:hypothetical protein FOA52_000571 [Chlamydomonas sp. UWO 241]|nr:hypothetical protein FOA52_000571 [Chlamydomonas sp. UWO 241]
MVLRHSGPCGALGVAEELSSVLYAPLTRDGRMEKFYYEPTREEALQMLAAMFSDLEPSDYVTLLDAFPAQPLDFFSSIKSRLVDGAVMEWVWQQGTLSQLQDALMGPAIAYTNGGSGRRNAAERPRVALPRVTLEAALGAGQELAHEQQQVTNVNLVKQYFRYLDTPADAAPQRPAPTVYGSSSGPESAGTPAARAYWDYLAAQSVVSRGGPSPGYTTSSDADNGSGGASSISGGGLDALASVEEVKRAAEEGAAMAAERGRQEAATAQAIRATDRGWPLLTPEKVHAALALRSAIVVDVRSSAEQEWGSIKGAQKVPAVLASGPRITPVHAPNAGFAQQVLKLAGPSDTLVLVGSSSAGKEGKKASEGAFVSKALVSLGGLDCVALAVDALRAAGFTSLSELEGGYTEWDLQYRPDGRRREKGNWADRSSGELAAAAGPGRLLRQTRVLGPRCRCLHSRWRAAVASLRCLS